MQINITFLCQIILFIFYILFSIKYIWPYINNIIEKRKSSIIVQLNNIKKFKLKINNLKKKIKKQEFIYEQKVFNMMNEINLIKNKILKEYRKKAKYEYNKILNNSKIEININKRKMYNDFKKNIYNILYTILKDITYNNFNKKIDNKIITFILNNNKIN